MKYTHIILHALLFNTSLLQSAPLKQQHTSLSTMGERIVYATLIVGGIGFGVNPIYRYVTKDPEAQHIIFPIYSTFMGLVCMVGIKGLYDSLKK